MMRLSYASTFVLLAFTLTPALAKDRNDRVYERAEERIQALQDRVDSGTLSDRQADKTQELIDKITEKFNIEPPPLPAPTTEIIWKDDFNREVGTNGWEGNRFYLDGEHLTLSSAAFQFSNVSHSFDLGGLPAYTDITVSYTAALDPLMGDKQFNTYWSADGGDWVLASPTIGDAGAQSFTVQDNGFQTFGLKFETVNFTGVTIDDVTLTGTLPADYQPAVTQ